jgi:NAD(P)-dependent dehydrogenase (short-subunit alcohol dehydrogenase family)
MSDQPEKVVVVTGASSGIGRIVSRALLAHGYRVVLAGRRADALNEAAEHHPLAMTVVTDVADPDSVEHLFDMTVRRWGRVDVLFNNAGTFGRAGAVDELSPADWQQVVNTNISGAFFCAQQAVRVMKAQVPQGGRIINNGSISAWSPRPSSVAYTATKHAMTGLTRSIALDARGSGVACGQIDIGNAATDILDRLDRSTETAEDAGGFREPTFDPHNVAEAVLFMAALPLDTNVLSMTLMATDMPFIGRG